MGHVVLNVRTLLPYILCICAVFLLSFSPISAQELYLVGGNQTTINPREYRAYYGKLSADSHVFSFETTTDTPVSFVILVPDVDGVSTDITAALTNTAMQDSPLLLANGALMEWSRFFDTAGRDSYLAGPMLATELPQGSYEVRVSSLVEGTPYILVVSGEKTFSLSEIARRYAVLPTIKSEFFGKPGFHAYLTPLVLRPIFAVLLLLGGVLFILILIRRRTPGYSAFVE